MSSSEDEPTPVHLVVPLDRHEIPPTAEDANEALRQHEAQRLSEPAYARLLLLIEQNTARIEALENEVDELRSSRSRR